MHDHLVQHLESRLPLHEVQAVYSVLLSPANLHVWGKTNTPSCLQCSGSVSLKHLLRSCSKALADRRYSRHHDQVLRAVADLISTDINPIKGHYKPKTLMFHRAGEKRNTQPRAKSGLLTSATDWRHSAKYSGPNLNEASTQIIFSFLVIELLDLYVYRFSPN